MASGTSTSGSLGGDYVSVGLLSFTPEIVFPMAFNSDAYDIGTFRIGPSVMCEWVASGASTNDCGAALELEVAANSTDGLRKVSGRIRTEAMAGNTRNSVALSVEHRF